MKILKTLGIFIIVAVVGCESTTPAKNTDAVKAQKPMERVAGHGTSEADRKEYIAEHDANADGSVSRAEVEAFRKSRFNSGDTNQNGVLDENEYIDEFMGRLDQQIADERKSHIKQTHIRFKSLDKNNNGLISWEEYQTSGDRAFAHLDKQNTGRVVAQGDEQQTRGTRSVLSMPTSHSVNGFLALYDENADGVVTREEFDLHRKQAFIATDLDKDGALNFNEYLLEFEGRLEQQAKRIRDQQRKQAHVRFGVLDKNKSGAIEWDEYLAMGLSGFDRWDVNRDGLVSAADPLPKNENWRSDRDSRKKKSE